ncbi:MAG: ATP-binding protein [Rhodoferax sp.]|jgi:predicted AAA+ superfamily ATPase|nr:ATP-binding protein [Rhodoferax sp.]
MIDRQLQPRILQALQESPAVALLGPRQVGKTTLALAVGRAWSERAGSSGVVYLDLESPSDRAKLDQPELYLADHRDKLVILDEVHRAPGLFPVLRGQIDRARREGRRAGLYLLLGSASVDLLRQAGESLAGRVAHLELAPLTLAEAHAIPPDVHWLRGGFPDSLLAASDAASLRWRLDFIRTYLEREVFQFAPRAATETLRRLWMMLAHHHGGLLNAAQFARNLGVDGKTVASYLDLLVDLMLVRRLQPWHANLGKRLVRTPKVYVRDSGVLHALLGITDKETLLSHPVVGTSWETWVVENLLALAPPDARAFFFRTAAGAEIDLLIERPGGERWAIEIKRSLQPKMERGFHAACEDVSPTQKWLVYPGAERYRLGDDAWAVGLPELAAGLRSLHV